MPLYEYECEACGHRFEHIHQRFSDPPIEKCPSCGGKVRKLLSSPAIQFKGSGFYITDYARKDQSSGPKSDGSGKAPAGENKEGAADKKESTADKTEAAPKTEKPAEKSPAADTPAAAKKD